MTVEDDEPTPAMVASECLELLHAHPLLSQLALRMAISFQDAAATCRRKACRETHRCHLTFDEQGVGQCATTYDTAAAQDIAAQMILFHIGYLLTTLRGEPWSPHDDAGHSPAGDNDKASNDVRPLPF